MTDDDILKDAKEAFDLAASAESHNRETALEDLKFARLGKQWPSKIAEQRQNDGRPCLTVNKLPAFIRQVVNDARQNKPSIKVHPADSKADPEVADIYNGLIRNIEYQSHADVAYDTATECAVGMGFGYFRIGIDYARDDTFDLDINVMRVSNPFSVYGDPASSAADSSDWNTGFVVNGLTKKEFERSYKGAAKVDWDGAGYGALKQPWLSDDGKSVQVAEWWTRDEYDKPIVLLSNGTIIARDQLDAEMLALMEIGAVTVVNERAAKCWKVRQHTLTGAEVLKSEDWPGQFIPIIPVYGDEIDVEGKRYFRSLIADAKDPQRMVNYWRTTSTELVALAPRVPFMGPKGAFVTDAAKWATINRTSHPFVEYDAVSGQPPPQRQPLDVGPAAGAMQEALNASDDMKAVMGLYDASLGARSNETSGRAILARQREGDVSTFHFLDNMSRAIRHAGRIMIDLIPHVYSAPRIVRVLGLDGSQEAVKVNQPTEVMGKNGRPEKDAEGNPLMRVYDLTAGKYDLTVSSGPSFTTRREEAAAQMVEFIRAFPAAAPVLGDMLARNMDWPEADEVAERLKKLLPPQLQDEGNGLPPQLQMMIGQLQEAMKKLAAENQQLKADKSIDMAKAQTGQYAAETDRFKVVGEMLQPPQQQPTQAPQFAA